MDTIIDQFKKSDSVVVRATFSEFKGIEYFNAREWFTKDKQNWYPGQKGISMPKALLPKFVTMVNKAEEEFIKQQPQEA